MKSERKDGRILLYRIRHFHKYWEIEFEWDFLDTENVAVRMCRTENPNVVVFMEDMLNRLGHKKTERKIW